MRYKTKSLKLKLKKIATIQQRNLQLINSRSILSERGHSDLLLQQKTPTHEVLRHSKRLHDRKNSERLLKYMEPKALARRYTDQGRQ